MCSGGSWISGWCADCLAASLRRARSALAAGSRLNSPMDLQAEAFQIDVLALVRLAGAAAVEAEAQETPQAGRLVVVVVAVGVGVRLQQPAPAAPLGARVGVLLPALEHAGHHL